MTKLLVRWSIQHDYLPQCPLISDSQIARLRSRCFLWALPHELEQRGRSFSMIAREFTFDTPAPRNASKPAVAWRGPALAQNGEWETALRVARRRLRLDSDDIGALEVIAQALVALGRAEESLFVIRSLVRLNPREPAYELWRAAALQTMGRYSEALTSLSRAHGLYREGRIKAKVFEEMELLIGMLEQSGREPMALWVEAGIAPPPTRRKLARDSFPVIS